VFSFGVLVLEIVSGTKISSFRRESQEGLLSYVSIIICVYLFFASKVAHDIEKIN
jgi:hypothetical protein